MGPRRLGVSRPQGFQEYSYEVRVETPVDAHFFQMYCYYCCLLAGADVQMPLWQIQVCGGAERAFTYQIVAALNDMLETEGLEDVKTLRDMEAKWHVCLSTGAPPPTGNNDPDGVGIVAWAPALYCGGATPAKGLEMIHKTLQAKVQKALVVMPQLKVWTPGALAFPLPDPWAAYGAAGFVPPQPFRVQPPRGKRHILAQLEVQPNEAENNDDEETPVKYMLSFFGGIYVFREVFEHHQIPGAAVTTGDGQKDYIRCLGDLMVDDDASTARISTVLNEILLGMPVFFINQTPSSHGMAATILLHFKSVVDGEAVKPPL